MYLGRDPSTNARVVIRTFELSREWRKIGELSDLLDALRKLCETTLDHPNLARPLAFGAEREIPYLVYSYLPGTALNAVMRKDGTRPAGDVLQRARQLAGAIDLAASEGIHHGLMAPGDVIVDGERTAVTGFGLAQTLIRVAIPAEGEPPYASPQRLAGAPPSHADDVYSLAAMTLELLIGTPADPDQDPIRALPERRRIQRPAPHETRMFTTIAGADAGKLRACFAAAFSDEPGERPSTAAEFVAGFEDAITSRRETQEIAPSVLANEFVSEERADPPAAPVEQDTRAVVRLAPIEDDTFIAEAAPPVRASSVRASSVRALSIDEAAPRMPVQSGSRALVVVAAIGFSFGIGFGGGFIAGQRSKPSTESIAGSRREPVADAQPARAAIAGPLPAPAATDDPKPVVSTTPTASTASKETVPASSKETVAASSNKAAAASSKKTVESGRLLVRSTPPGASVVVDGRSRGVTPLTVGELALGAHSIEVAQPDQAARWLRVNLSDRHPERSIDFDFRPADSPGSLQVASRPSEAQVFVDDTLIGTTPLLLSNVAAGSRRVRIELSGYKSWTTSVQIEPGARLRVSARLEP